MSAHSDSKILVLTAAFGEGHNSAARNLAEALRGESGGAVAVEVFDPISLASPRLTMLAKWGYHAVTNRLPRVWEWLFEVTREGPHGPAAWDAVAGVMRWLAEAMRVHRPDTVVSTYPLYPHFLAALPAGVPRPRRVWVVVTDSITIHPIWTRCAADGWLVTDAFSREVVVNDGVPSELVSVTGFPVSPLLARGGDEGRGVERARVLYFATTGTPHARATTASLLRELPADSRLAIVMGRSEERLRPVLEPLVTAATAEGRQVQLVGWCRDVPERMAASDVVVTKAGGATVHECLAAGVPAVVNYVIPGQEEGNIALLERLGTGCRAPLAAEATGAFLAGLIRDGRLASMQSAMRRERRPDGAMLAARRILGDMGISR